jgi:predicted DNA-binding transcriptional regulator AlpA
MPAQSSLYVLFDFLQAEILQTHRQEVNNTKRKARVVLQNFGRSRSDGRDSTSGKVPITFITVEEFALAARLSRRQIDRLRKTRPEGFPREYELGSGLSKHRSCPRFKLCDVLKWLDSRALW